MTYEAAPGCPSRATFTAGLHRLSPKLMLLSDGVTRDPQLRVELKRHGDTFVGHLTHGETNRSVAASACADTAYALAVIAAITLDPAATVESTVAASDFAEPENPATPTEQPSRSPAPELPTSKLLKPEANQQLRVTRPFTHWKLFAGPAVSWGDIGALGIGAQLDLLATGKSPWSSFGVSLQGASTRRQLDVTTLTFSRLGLGLAWCPGGNTPWRPLSARLCVGGEVGVARTFSLDSASFSSNAAFTRFNALASADVLLSFALGRNWSAGVRPKVNVALIRDDFVLESGPGVTVESITHSPLTVSGILQVGYVLD